MPQAAAAPRDPVAEKCQQILRQCLNGHAGAKPLFTGEAQRIMLMDYVLASLRASEPKRADENPTQYAAKTRAINNEKVTIQKAFTQQFSSQVELDETTDPSIFLIIKNQLKQIEKQNKIQRICSVFSYSVDQCSALTDMQLQQIYLKALQVDESLEAAGKTIEYFCTRAGQPKNTIQIASLTASASSTDPTQNMRVTLTAPNEAIGYSIYNLLVIADIFPNQPFAGNPSKQYAEPMTFTLTYDQFKVLQAYLGDLSVWYRDFENILSSLFDTDANTYVKTGCKPLREAVKTEMARERNRDTLLMNPDVRERFAEHPSDVFVLLGQAAIDLTYYPRREEMRALIQDIYAQCGLEDSKKEAKTFVKDESDGLTFISLLSVGHIRQIYDEIMALSSLTKSAKDIEFSLFDYISLIGAGDAKGLYHNYLELILVDIIAEITPLQRGETVASKRRRIEVSVTNEFKAPSAAESLSAMQTRFQKTIQKILNERMDIKMRPATEQRDRIPTDQEKYALLSSNRLSSPLVFQITNDSMLDKVITMLKASRNYPTLSNAYTAYYQSLGAHPRLASQTQFNNELIYMYSTLDECIDKLSTEFKRRGIGSGHIAGDELTYALQAWLNTVMKIVYAQKMHIPQAALTRAAERFGDIFKIDHGRDDLGQGCNTGLSGRCLLIDSQLVAGEENVFMQFNRQLLIDEVEQSFNDTIGSSTAGESSMAARAKPVIMAYTGLQVNNTGRSSSAAGNIDEFMRDLATRYNPGKIYEKCYEYLCEEFKKYIRLSDDENMEALLSSLGYHPENDATLFQIDGKWNIKRFEAVLPGKVIQLLQNKLITEPGMGQLIIESSRMNYSFNEAIHRKQQRIHSTSAGRNTMFVPNPQQQPRVTMAAAAAVAAPTWSSGGLYRPAGQPPQATQQEVDLRGDSKISKNPGTGSTT
jgi:hypothetical protein